MEAYLVPSGEAESEYVEKRSRFLGHVWRVETEPEARARIEEMRKRYHDARHHCWCYVLREGGIVRYSDDGEPQGTAGQPMLNVFQREGIYNVCCVVSRYFGGILLGAGGLNRAYAKTAKDALDAAGAGQMCRWSRWSLPCTYPLFERVKLEVTAAGGVLEEATYGAAVEMTVAFPAGREAAFHACLTELSAGALVATALGEVFRLGPADGA